MGARDWYFWFTRPDVAVQVVSCGLDYMSRASMTDMALRITHHLQFLDPLAGTRPPDILPGPGDVY